MIRDRKFLQSLLAFRKCSVALLFIAFSCSLHGQAVLEDFEGSGIRKGPDGTTPLWLREINPAQTLSIENHLGSNRLKVVVTGPESKYGADMRVMFYPNTGVGGYRYPYPGGFMRSYIKSGTWSPTMNRLEFWTKCSASLPFTEWGGKADMGTYVKPFRSSVDPDSQGAHWYNLIGSPMYTNEWVKHVLFWSPPSNNFSPKIEHPANPTYNGSYTTSPPENYWNGLTRFYFGLYQVGQYPFTCYLDNFVFYEDFYKPDSRIKNLSVTYDGSRYVVTFGGKKGTPVSNYELRYSTTSMKKAGWNAGSIVASAQSNGSDFTQVQMKTSAMARSNGTVYFGLKVDGSSDFVEVRYDPAIQSTDGSTAPVTSPCDLNSDGSVTSADSDLSIQSALGARACTGDLDENGKCDVVDTQRVINASLGSPCKAGM